MSIQLVTYANQTVTPTNDAIIYEKAIDQNGIFYGCNVTVTSNNVNITGGYGLVCGREFVINSESIAVTLAPSGTLEGRLYVRLDLADADAPIQLLTATGNTLPALVQDDDVNYTNGVWEMELATFTVGVSSLSDVVETFETIIGAKQWPKATVENLGTGVTIVRFGDMRILILNHALGSVLSGITLPVEDRPPTEDARGSGVRRTSGLGTIYDGLCIVRYNTGAIQCYYANTYAASITAIGSTDVFVGNVVWIV